MTIFVLATESTLFTYLSVAIDIRTSELLNLPQPATSYLVLLIFISLIGLKTINKWTVHNYRNSCKYLHKYITFANGFILHYIT